eukprot:m.745888 g.745888  ORF g.745888 m.745888 type:complete len:50 (-) comp23129_c0_seq9:236-385(-)
MQRSDDFNSTIAKTVGITSHLPSRLAQSPCQSLCPFGVTVTCSTFPHAV